MSNLLNGAVAERGCSRRSRSSKVRVLLRKVAVLAGIGWTAITPVLAAEVISFPAGTGGWHLGTLGLGNLDTDAQLEIVVPYRDGSARWFLDAFKADGTRILGFPYGGGLEEINVSPTLYDLNGDGRAEILFTQGNRVVALRGNGTVLWSNVVTRLNYLPNGGYMTVTNGFYWSDGGGLLAIDPQKMSATLETNTLGPINTPAINSPATAGCPSFSATSAISLAAPKTTSIEISNPTVSELLLSKNAIYSTLPESIQ